MGLDNLHRTTLDVMCVAAWHIAGASFLVTVFFGLANNSGAQTAGQQNISAVCLLSLFVAIGTSVRLWMHERRVRRRNEGLASEGQRV